MRSPRKKPGPKPWKRVPGVVQRVHRTATEWREILARFGASGQSKTKFCEQNAIARSTFILWERRLASGDDGSTPGSAAEWFVEVEDDGDEVPPPRGSGLFAELTEAGALVTDPGTVSTAADTPRGGSGEKPASGAADVSEPGRSRVGRNASSAAGRAARGRGRFRPRARAREGRRPKPKPSDVDLGVQIPLPASGQTTPATVVVQFESRFRYGPRGPCAASSTNSTIQSMR